MEGAAFAPDDGVGAWLRKLRRGRAKEENGMRVPTSAAIVALALALAAPLAPVGAQGDESFPLTCQGTLQQKGGQYFFAESEKLNPDPDDNIVCSHVTIAEKSTSSAPKQSLKEAAIERLLRACRVGSVCKVSGSVLNLSHDLFVYVKIDAMSRK
jgi:hypothetical protein